MQKSVADQLNIPVPTLQSYEYGRVAIRFGFALRLSNRFGISLAWLARGGEQGPKGEPQISQDTARFIPPDVLLSDVSERLLLPLEREYQQIPERDRWCLGECDVRRKWELRLAQNLRIKTLLQVVPDSLFWNLSEAIAEFIANFLEENKAEVDEALQRYGIFESQYAESLAVTALRAARALGVSRSDVARAHENFLKNFPLGLATQQAGFPEIGTLEIEREIALLEKGNPRQLENFQLTDSNEVRSSVVDENIQTTENMQKNLTIADRLREARTKLNLTQEQAAKTWGVSLGTLRDWEQERTQPRGKALKRITEVLGTIG